MPDKLVTHTAELVQERKWEGPRQEVMYSKIITPYSVKPMPSEYVIIESSNPLIKC